MSIGSLDHRGGASRERATRTHARAREESDPDPPGSRASKPSGAAPHDRSASYPGFKAFIKRVATGPRGNVDLSFAEAREAFGQILDGEVTPSQASAFLVGMRLKGETAPELAGFAAALRERCEVSGTAARRPLVTCAGGYDGMAGHANLSVAAAVTAAACGAAVVLHAGPRVGPKHGVNAATVLLELGARVELSPERSTRVLERTGIGFYWTPKLCPAWERLRALRHEIGVRTSLSAAEKLLSPVAGGGFLIGLSHMHYADRLRLAMAELGDRRVVVVRGREGSDFVSSKRPRVVGLGDELDAPAELAAAGAEANRTPLPSSGLGAVDRPQTARLGSLALPPNEFPGAAERASAALRDHAGAEGSAALTRLVLRPAQGEDRCGTHLLGRVAEEAVGDALAFNAALRLRAAGVAPSPWEGTRRVRVALRQGRAALLLDRFLAATWDR